MVQFLSINIFSWISSIFVGFFKSSRFFVSPCTRSAVKKVRAGIELWRKEVEKRDVEEESCCVDWVNELMNDKKVMKQWNFERISFQCLR